MAYLAASALLLFSCEKDKENPQEQINTGDPVVTAEATDVTMNSALLYGYVNTEYLLMGDERGFIVSTSSTPSLENGQKYVSSEVDRNGKYFVQVSGLTSSTTYYYKAFLNTGTTNLVGEIKSFTTKEFGFAAVDIGLSVKWANANLGATAPEGYGDYYAWGETETQSDYSWSTYKFGNYSSLSKYNTDSAYGTVDNKTKLDPEDDVAHVKLGGNWRMPTSSEVAELISTRKNSGYQWEWISLNGHNGWLVTYLVNNNSIFLPAAGYWNGASLSDLGSDGYYWSSSLNTDLQYDAWYVNFDTNFIYRHSQKRHYGFSVRPVTE